ncbi:flagellar hook basal-body protein [Treponema sp. OMZ 840]|uniref:hypothetical protein n=1 Tax=Treponema sp. OMZ 840 TaxID=244313 RepID=UPI003D91C8DE
MKNKVLFFLIVLYAVSGMYALSPENEYDYLYTDLMNFYTYGYKKTFDERIMKSNGKINFAQGSLTVTGNKTDIAIQGSGFFKVLDSEGNDYYTRCGNILWNTDFKLVIKCADTIYYLPAEPLPAAFTSIEIKNDGYIVCEYFESEKIKNKKTIGRIILYDISNNDVEYYDGYVIKTKTKLTENTQSAIHNKCLELSNVRLDDILIRMLFLIEKMDDSLIKGKKTKKFLIEKLLDIDYRKSILRETFSADGQMPLLHVSAMQDYLSCLKRDYE